VLAPAAFALQVVVGYAVAADTCDSSRNGWTTLPLINLIAFTAIGAGLAISLGNFRRTRREGDGDHRAVQSSGRGRTRFLAYFGLCMSGVFALAVLVQLTSILVLHRCIGLPVLP
jgi:hypothetical protein